MDVKNGRNVLMQNSEHLVLRWLSVFALSCSLSVSKIKWVVETSYFFSFPEACWFSSLWMSRYVLNWASMKKKTKNIERLLWVEVLVGIGVHDDPASKVQSCDCESL